MDFISHLLLSLNGRIGRLSFWIGTAILGVIRFAAPYLIIAIVGLSERAVLLAVIAGLALAYPSYALMAKRFQDRDKPGVLALALIGPFYAVNLLYTLRVFDPLDPTPIAQALDAFILIIALWFLIELGFLKGTQGPNRYGPDPSGRTEADARL